MDRSSIRTAGRVLPAGIVFAVVGVASSARAEIQDFSANVEAEVQEFIGESPSDSRLAFESFPGPSTSNLPMVAEATFAREDSSGPKAGAVAVTTFSDPRQSNQASPEEFGLTTGAFSLDASLSHTARGKATEQRTIVFNAAEVGLATGTAIQVQSRFFIDGVMLVWSQEGVSDTSNLSTSFHATVVQARTGSAPATVLSAEIVVKGGPSGTIDVTASGAVSTQNVVSLDLGNFVQEIGALRVVVLPELGIPYTYEADVGETFTLTATIETSAESDPAAGGAAVVLGAPLDQLGALINQVTGGRVGDEFVTTVANAVANAPLPLVRLLPSTGTQIVPLNGGLGNVGGVLQSLLPLCGPIGLVPLGAMFLLAGPACALGRRRR